MHKTKLNYKNGFIKGIPIGLGYLPVSFTFGLMAVESGLPIWLVIFTSLSNVTSAGQFAGVNLITAGAGYVEIALTTAPNACCIFSATSNAILAISSFP